MTDFFDSNMFGPQYQQGQNYGQQQQQQYGGPPQQGYAPPGQGYPGYGPPQAPAYYGPQGGQQPQGAPGYGPPAGYPGGYAPGPQVPQQPLAQGTLDDFYDQAAGASMGLKFDNKGDWYQVVIPRELTNADVRQRERNGVPQVDKSGRPKWVLVVPVIVVASNRGDVQRGDERSWWLSAADKDAMVEALTSAANAKGHAGRLTKPPAGVGMQITYFKDKPNGPGFNPTKLKQVQAFLPADWTPPAETTPPEALPKAAQETMLANGVPLTPAQMGQVPGPPAMTPQPMPDFPPAMVPAQSAPQGPPPWDGAPGTGPANTAAPVDEAQTSFAQPGNMYSMVPGPHGGPVAVPPGVPAQHAAAQGQPPQAVPSDSDMMAAMQNLIGGQK